MERAIVLSGGGPLDVPHFPLEAYVAKDESPLQPSQPSESLQLNSAVEALEAKMITTALRETSDNKTKAARLLDISERSLWYKLKKYRLE